jgi:hypothetical protein
LHAKTDGSDEPPTPEPPVPPGTIKETAFAKETRQQLEKIAARFAQLTVAASSPSNVVVTFTDLEQRVGGESPSKDSGIVVSNEDGVVSISMNGINVKDKKKRDGGFVDGLVDGFKGFQTTNQNDHEHVRISIGGMKINVNEEPTNDWQKIEGSLVGTRQADAKWLFLGAGKLAAVSFEMDETNLQDALPAGTDANAHEILQERLDAAKTIVDETLKDKLLRALSADAARIGEAATVKSALAEMIDMDSRDAAAHDAALQLAAAGRRKEALEIAKSIADPDIRDQAMTALATDPRLLKPNHP